MPGGIFFGLAEHVIDLFRDDLDADGAGNNAQDFLDPVTKVTRFGQSCQFRIGRTAGDDTEGHGFTNICDIRAVDKELHIDRPKKGQEEEIRWRRQSQIRCSSAR